MEENYLKSWLSQKIKSMNDRYPYFKDLRRAIIKVGFSVLLQNLLHSFKCINGILFLWVSTKTILYSVSTYPFLWKSSFC